jgi:hypothetical protein
MWIASALVSMTGAQDITVGGIVIAKISGTTLTVSSIAMIPDRAFVEVSNVTALTIPDSVTSIGDYAFDGMSGVTTLIIPNSIITIGNSVFEGMSGVTTLTIPDSVTTIGSFAFQGMSGVKGTLTIPNSVTSIGWSAFEGMSGVTTLFIGTGLTHGSVNASSFSGMSGVVVCVGSTDMCTMHFPTASQTLAPTLAPTLETPGIPILTYIAILLAIPFALMCVHCAYKAISRTRMPDKPTIRSIEISL